MLNRALNLMTKPLADYVRSFTLQIADSSWMGVTGSPSPKPTLLRRPWQVS